MAIDYNDLRKASTPNGIIGLLSSLGHEPTSDWDGLVDIRDIILEDNIPDSIRSSVADDALTIREMSSLVGEEKGIECYCAILRPGLTLSSSVCRNLSHAFRNVSSITHIDETFLFIGVTNENHNGSINGETEIIQWATIHLSRVYRKAGSSEELRLSRLDWKPTKKSRHTLDCLKSLQVDAYPGQVDDTEVERFKKEVKEWFNKEKLSRRFFREFYKRFESALDLVQRKALLDNYEQFQPSKNKPITSYNKKDRESDSNRQNAGKFMLKQILRLLFLHYLQEKEWLCRDKHFLINQWRRYEKKTRSLPNYDATTATGFHSEVLIPLFFETLNRRRPDDATNNWGGTRWDKGERSLMPYLNGGIFDIDKVVDHWDFDARKPMFLIPDAVFSADRDYEPALDDGALTGRQVNILAFLDDYHFTIAEDTPVDEAVALDPELMGKIFENLLVSRHSDGAYYTPRVVVRFQCKDTLARYLEEQLADIGGLNHDWFLTLFDLDRDFSDVNTWNDELFTPVVADRIEVALKECKVLDPAVGSGAYLLGMLNEMLRLRQLCHKVRTGNMVDRGSIEFYRWKSEIIRDSLYGVDINPEAVAICHLRLWLAMVVDQDRESASALPNLDFQVTAGDSLRDSINGNRIFVAPGQKGQASLWSYMDGEESDQPNDEPIRARIGRIRELRHEYYSENASPSKRYETREELQTLRLQMMLEGLNQLEHYELKELKKSNMSATKRDKVENDLIAKFNDTRRRINEGTFTSIFSYEAIFGDVFQRENRMGFDIVIGNPPYVEDEGTGGYDDIQEALNLNSNNLYAMFWVKSLQDLARLGGQVSYITPDTFLTLRTHAETRASILRESRPHYFIKTGHWFFTFSNSWTTILTVTKREACSNATAAQISEITVAYDLTKLPAGDLHLLDMALSSWKPSVTSRARTSDLNSNLIDHGDQSTWYCGESGRNQAIIGRYAYPCGLPWKNSNVPIFHACPKLFKLTWDNGEYYLRPKLGVQYSKSPEQTWLDSIPRNLIEFNSRMVEMTKLREIANVRQGLATADDNYYLRKEPEARGRMDDVNRDLVLTPEDLEHISNNENLRKNVISNGIPDTMFNGRVYIPFSKPPKQEQGKLNMFHCRSQYYINWSSKCVRELKSATRGDVKRRLNPNFIGTEKQERDVAAVIRNADCYFQPMINVSLASDVAPQYWIGTIGVPGHKASIVQTKNYDSNLLLGALASHIFIYLAKAFRGTLVGLEIQAQNESPLPLIINKNSISSVNELVQNKISGGEIRYDNEKYWDTSISSWSSVHLTHDDKEEIKRWFTRYFPRQKLDWGEPG